MATIEPLTKEQLEDWAKTLESDKYIQGVGALITDGENDEGEAIKSYCCLGVLADMRNELTKDGCFSRTLSKDQDCYLKGDTANCDNSRPYYLPIETQEAMTIMNDEEGADFYKIAAFIREELIPKARK